MRDMLVHTKGFSELEAEELIDTLELRGFLRFLGDPTERSVADAHWEIHAARVAARHAPLLEDQPAEARQRVEVAHEERREGLALPRCCRSRCSSR